MYLCNRSPFSSVSPAHVSALAARTSSSQGYARSPLFADKYGLIRTTGKSTTNPYSWQVDNRKDAVADTGACARPHSRVGGFIEQVAEAPTPTQHRAEITATTHPAGKATVSCRPAASGYRQRAHEHTNPTMCRVAQRSTSQCKPPKAET